MRARVALRRVHVWLGWLIGVPVLFWTASGLFMVARPIEEVRGVALRAPPRTLTLPERLTSPAGNRPIRSLTLAMQQGRSVWLIGYADGGAARADAATGRLLPGPDADGARALARAALARDRPVRAVTRSTAAAPPLDLRQPRPAWGVRFADATRIYIDADSGAVLALRSEQWRWFDWMWGLHIMDLQGREDSSHPILIASAAIALVATLAGLALLPWTRRRRRPARDGG